MDRRSCVKSLPEKVPMSVQRALLWGGLLLMVGSANGLPFRSVTNCQSGRSVIYVNI